MAKEFKEYDRKYARYMGKLVEGEVGIPEPIPQWPFMAELVKPSHAIIRHAVYFADGAEEWQKFRVSLKGWPTSMKLARLKRLWEYAKVLDNKVLIVRLNNYIDSMKRSGLLDSTGHVIAG